MKTAFYHMAVWNVQEAGDIIKEIIEDNDKNEAVAGVGAKSVAEKVREKAAIIRRNERLGLNSRMIGGGYGDDQDQHYQNGGEPMSFGHYENGHAGNG